MGGSLSIHEPILRCSLCFASHVPSDLARAMAVSTASRVDVATGTWFGVWLCFCGIGGIGLFPGYASNVELVTQVLDCSFNGFCQRWFGRLYLEPNSSCFRTVDHE